MNYLQSQLCSETLEFLRDSYLCQELAKPLYPHSMIRPKTSGNIFNTYIPSPEAPEEMSEAEFDKELKAHQERFQKIVDKYIVPDSLHEVNLPVRDRKPFLQVYQDTWHPDLLSDLIEHISDMLRQNNLSKFLAIAKDIKSKPEGPLSKKKISIKHVVLNKLPSPHSVKGVFLLDDFNICRLYEFLDQGI